MVKKIFSSFILLVSVYRQAVRSHRGSFFTLPCFLWVQGHLYRLGLPVRAAPIASSHGAHGRHGTARLPVGAAEAHGDLCALLQEEECVCWGAGLAPPVFC